MAQVVDWQSRKTFQECNRYMLENEISCDVMFLVGAERKQIHAHKYVLISRSSVFQAMFCGPLAEQDNNINIPDISTDAFTSLLRYLYYEDIQLASESALGVLYAAKKYAIGGLEDHIISWLNDNITTESVCTILNEAVLYSEKNLEVKCLSFIDTHAGAILPFIGFNDLTKESLMKVLERDSLEADEVNVFDAVLDWSKAECSRRGLTSCSASQRDVLGEAIYLVRFSLLSSTYFAENVASLDILSHEERTQIMQNHETASHSKFSSKPRSKTTLKNFPLTMQQALSGRHAQQSTKEEVSDYIRLRRERKSLVDQPDG